MCNTGWLHFFIFYSPLNPPQTSLGSTSTYSTKTVSIQRILLNFLFLDFLLCLTHLTTPFSSSLCFSWRTSSVCFSARAISVLPWLLFFCSTLKWHLGLWSPPSFHFASLLGNLISLCKFSYHLRAQSSQISVFSPYLSPDPQIDIHYIEIPCQFECIILP